MTRSEYTEVIEGDATQILTRVKTGDRSAPARLMPLIYDELRELAARYLRWRGRGHTLQPTELVHEAYLKLVDQSRVVWRDRAHFLAIAAQAMRRLLADYSRRRGAMKRGGRWQRVTLSEADAVSPERSVDLTELEEALEALAALHQRQYYIVLFRFFGGMTNDEVAEVLSVSTRTVEDDWRMARAWLHRCMTRSHG